MKRRLTRAYDSMTMPDGCANTIERKLTEQLDARKTGTYIQTAAPTPVRPHGWAVGVAAVCLMLVLSVGGTMLFLGMSGAQLGRQKETVARFEETEAAPTPEDHYALVTDLSAEEVEAFATIVRHNILEGNWEALKNKFAFPLTVQGQEIQDWQAFQNWMNGFSLYSSAWKQLEAETCRAMFCNWQGICMADGFVWFNEVEGGLKITAMNMDVEPITVTDTPVKQVPEVFAEVLAGKPVYFYGGNYDPRTLEEYCAGRWGDVTVDLFAVVDMDQDGICEVVVSCQIAQTETRVHLVLRQDGKYVCGYPFQPGELMDLKKDGSFFRRDRDHRLYFNDEESWYTTEAQEQEEKPLAQWHAYPCVRPDMVLRSYEYVTGTGWSSFPGMPYSYFESLVMKRAENRWEPQGSWLANAGYIDEEENTVYLLDPDAPGTVMFGTLTEENGTRQFSSIGYYISNEYGELQGEVRNIHTDSPEYWMGTLLEQLDSHGWQVQSPDEFIAYFGYTAMPDGRARQDRAAIWELIDLFAAECLSENQKALQAAMTEDCSGRIEGVSKGAALEVVTYSHLYDLPADVDGTCTASAGLRTEDGGSCWLNLELVKQKSGWKIQSYNLYKNEE